MTVAIRRAARRPIPRPFRKTTASPVNQGDTPPYREVYEMLYEAAHLVTRASRELRNVSQNDIGFALQDVANELHEHIRQLPEPSRHQSLAPPFRRRTSSDC